MSTMQQAPPAEAVEEQMGKIVTELGAALGVLLTSLGTRSGLWAALHPLRRLTRFRSQEMPDGRMTLVHLARSF